jgi:hypothetical protein
MPWEQWQQQQRQLRERAVQHWGRREQQEQWQQRGGRRREPREFRKGPWIVGGVLVYAAAAYGAYAYRAFARAADESRRLDGAVLHDVSARYDATAGSFDGDVALAEWLMGMGRLRRKLVREAMAAPAPAVAPSSPSSSSSSSSLWSSWSSRWSSWWSSSSSLSSLLSSSSPAGATAEEGASSEGAAAAAAAGAEVLEVSVGTGRNARYYDVGRCKRITFVDKSAPMLEKAREQFFREFYTNGPITMPLPPPPPLPPPFLSSLSLHSILPFELSL